MKSVLLIEGSTLFSGFLKDKFSTEQVSLESANSREAFTKLVSSLPDLVIIELNEDGIDEHIQTLLDKKHMDPNAKKIPIIITGPVIDRAKISQLVEYNVIKYFTKPINFDLFFEAVGRVLHSNLSMDTTPCILDMHLNGNIIFVEVALGLNREKLLLLKYKLAEIIDRYRIHAPKVVLLLTNLNLSFMDGANLELLFENITADKRVANKNINILSLDDFVSELVEGHPEYTGMRVAKSLNNVLTSLVNQDSAYDKNEFVVDKVLSFDREIDNQSLDFSEAHTTAGSANTGSVARIAVVDDDVVVRKILENSFSGISADTTLFESGSSFIQAIMSGESFDLVILDLYIADMDGISILKNLQDHSFETPIIIYSKATDRNIIIKALSLGAKSYLIKPQKPEVIINKAVEILHKNSRS